MVKKNNFGYCDTCNAKLIIPSWINCNNCDPYMINKIKMNSGTFKTTPIKKAYLDMLIFKKIDRKKAEEFDILYDDETFEVIGYRKPIYILKE
jgi:hypothetical protein